MWKIAALFVCLCSAWYFEVTVRRQLPALAAPGDFVHYYRAGQAILHGTSPFNDPEYLYPPLVAFAAAPLALADLLTARWIWFVVSQVCLLAAAVLIWRAAGRNWIAACCVAAVWAFGGAAEESLALGQIGPLLVLLLAIAFTQGPAAQGAASGLGLCLKYVPGVLLAGLVLERSWRAVVWFGASTVVFLLAPWAFLGAKAPVSGDYWMGTPALLSWSIPSTVLRILDPPHGGKLPFNWEYGNVAANLHLPLAMHLASVGACAVTLAVGVVMLGKLTSKQLPLALVGLLSLGLAAAPVCWTHYQVMQYPGLALLASRAIERRHWWIASAVALGGAMLYPIPVAVLRSYHNAHGGWTAASPATLYFWTSVTPLACLLLFALSVWAMRRDW